MLALGKFFAGWKHCLGRVRQKSRGLAFAGLSFVVLVFAFLSIDRVLPDTKHPLVIAADLAIALLCGGFLVKVMYDGRTRHRKILQRLEVIGEMNHHIRNALEQITSSAYTSHDQKMIENLHLAVSRIEWALREVLPQDLEDQLSVAKSAPVPFPQNSTRKKAANGIP